MNILAHLILSGNSPGIRFGNFIADAVKGRDFLEWEGEDRKGILLHRFIDTYTDTHESALIVRRKLAVKMGLYAPVALDLIFDHLLARDWNNWHHEPLGEFTSQCYLELQSRQNEMPERIAYMFGYMQKHDWLWNYQFEEGITRSLRGLSQRVKGNPPLEKAMEVLKEDEELVETQFKRFYTDIQLACNQMIESQL